MKPRTLAIMAALAMVMACRDGPTSPTVPLEDSAPQTALVEPVRAPDGVFDLFTDPFILELIGTVKMDALSEDLEAVHVAAVRGDLASSRRALTAARRRLAPATTDVEADHDAAILHDVLELVLSDTERAPQPPQPEHHD